MIRPGVRRFSRRLHDRPALLRLLDANLHQATTTAGLETAWGVALAAEPSDGMILVIGPRLEGHSVIFLAIQTHLSRRFHLAIDFPGLRRSGSSPQIIDQAQDFPEQFPRHRHLGKLERDVAAMADHLGTDLHQFLP